VVGDPALPRAFSAAASGRADSTPAPGRLLVGGKTGIDTPQGKNLIGAFHQPGLVLADIAVLETLTQRDFRSGYAEVMKYGLLGDAPFFAWLEGNWQKIFSGKGAARASAIATSCRAKAAIVEADEREESGTRALLNLGHTFGHALEAFAGYSDRLLHGEAIAIGMRLAFTSRSSKGFARPKTRPASRGTLDVGLPTESRRSGQGPTTGAAAT
jgi:3-dehydroquinate synthetase